MTKVIYVAEAPARKRNRRFAPELAFADASTPTAKRFRSLAGDVAPAFNLFDRALARSGKGTTWPIRAARKKAVALAARLPGMMPIDVFVFVGLRVAKAFGIKCGCYFWQHWCELTRTRCYVVPHPSGVNRWWNNPKNVVDAERFFASLRRETQE